MPPEAIWCDECASSRSDVDWQQDHLAVSKPGRTSARDVTIACRIWQDKAMKIEPSPKYWA